MAKPCALVMVVSVLVLVKLAMSELLVPDVAPGNVPTPELQLLVVGAAIQLLLEGAASHVALMALAELLMTGKLHTSGRINNAGKFKEAGFLRQVFIGL
jgi:hypothetical protein